MFWMIASQKWFITNAPDTLLENLNSYHPNIKFTVEENPDHFVDTSLNKKMEISLQKFVKNQENYNYVHLESGHSRKVETQHSI